MSKTCTILAHVKRPDGRIVESNLFKDLLHYTSNDRKTAKKYYAIGTDKEFLSKAREKEEFKTDENGEITLPSLRSIAQLDFDTDKVLQVLNKDIGEGTYPYEEALRKVQQFNENNSWADKMMATMVSAGKGKYYVSVIPQTQKVTHTDGSVTTEGGTGEERKKLHDVVRNEEMEKRIKELLKSHGVGVTFLESENEGGRYSTENVSKIEEGLYGLIQINESGNTTKTLAEEAGHFAVAALGENPLVQRLLEILGPSEMQKEALGEEYDTIFLGENPAKEVAGRLVGKALIRKLDGKARYKVLANRVANLAKRVFYSIKGNELRWAAAKAEQIANRIAYQFAEGSNKFSVDNALSIKETMFHKDNLSTNQRVYRDAMDEMGRMVKRLQAISEDNLAEVSQASLAMATIKGTDDSGKSALQIDGLQGEALAFDGVVQAFVQVTDYLGPGKEISQLMDAVDLDSPAEFYSKMANNGRNLRQARVFLRSAARIVKLLSQATNTTYAGRGLKVTSGTSITDVRYQDENGNWKSIDLKHAINVFSGIIYRMNQELTNLESAYFARFCEDIYGNKYVTTSTGVLWNNIWSGEETEGEQQVSIEDMINGEGMDDIDVFHRFLGSMSNNPDIIGQIADKIVKNANKTADDLTFEYQDRLIILQERAKNLGIDFNDLVEKDENGVPTGNMVTPPASPTDSGNTEEDAIYDTYIEELGYSPAVHYGSWEKAREDFMNTALEAFKAATPGWESLSGFARGYAWEQFISPKNNARGIDVNPYSIKKWNAENSFKVEVKDPDTKETMYVKWVPNARYESNTWDELQRKYKDKDGDSLRQWVSDYRKIKRELDSFLPTGTTSSYRLPQFRGTFMNTVRNSRALEKGRFKTLNSWRKTFGRRGVLESFGILSESFEYGDLHTMNSPEEDLLGTRMNFAEERAARLPVFGINKLKNLNELSTDLLHSMLSYASMATSYHTLSNVVDALEVGKEVLHRRTFKKKGKVKDKENTIGDPLQNPPDEYESLDVGSKNRAYTRYIKFLDKQVYGVTATHWGIPLGKGRRFVLHKLISNISALGGRLFLHGNVLGGAVNTGTGAINIFKEAVTGDDISASDWKAAHAYYFNPKTFVTMWTKDWGNLRKTTKLGLFLSHMNAQSSNKEKFRSWHTSRSWLNNMTRTLGYLPYSSGDHYMQAMSYLSLAHGIKLYDEDGDFSDRLWDCYVMVNNTDSFGNKTGSSTLEYNGLCPLSSSDITTDKMNEKRVLLKEVKKSTSDFENWLVWHNSDFADETYKKNHPADYLSYKRMYESEELKDLMWEKSRELRVLKSILEKTENYLDSSGPIPSYDIEEENYINNIKKVGTGNYADIAQVVRDDIFKMIWTKADESAYMDRCRELNNRLHGIYNEQDKTEWHQRWYTNAFLAMKGWALGYIEYMYSPNHYSMALERNTEGFVNTFLKVFVSILVRGEKRNKAKMSIGMSLLNIFWPWSKAAKRAMIDAGYSEEQNFNMRRAIMSVFTILSLMLIRAATAPPDDDDEEKDTMKGLIYYLAGRMCLEQEALLYIPETFVQTGQLMDFMPVGGAAVYDLFDLFVIEGGGALVGAHSAFYHKDDPNGKYEDGDAKFWNHLIRLTPYWKSVWNIEHPYEAYKNYEFGRKLRSR